MRKCYKCGDDITNEPALEGLGGLLCFPCRYRLDANGGEKFIRQTERCPKEHADWRARYGLQWWTFRILDYASRGLAALAAPAICFVWGVCGNKWEKQLGPPLFLLLPYVLLGASFIPVLAVSACEKRWPCPAPPSAPPRTGNALWSNPTVVIDGTCGLDGNPQWVNFPNGYPPDWSERKARCRQRDKESCRLCGSNKRLHVHHIKPVSSGGSHTLQNLITLCRRCHMRQKYYDHRVLVEKALTLKAAYYSRR